MLRNPLSHLDGVSQKHIDEMYLNLLDLNKVNLYTFQSYVFDTLVESMLKGIEEGDHIPAVYVYKIDENTYRIARWENKDGSIDGGTNRAVSHYIANKPLLVLVIPLDGQEIKLEERLHVSRIRIKEDEGQHHFRYRQQVHPNYRNID